MALRNDARLAKLVRSFAAKPNDTRHKCFLSYHSVDEELVANFVSSYGSVFIPKVIGIAEEDPLISGKKTDDIMDEIREKYLTDSTVTVVLLGSCTWARRFVDWEVYSSLRRDKVNRLNGLMAVNLPSIGKNDATKVPLRVADNLPKRDGTPGYGRWYQYPTSARDLKGWIQDAYDARVKRNKLINNTRTRKIKSAPCP